MYQLIGFVIQGYCVHSKRWNLGIKCTLFDWKYLSAYTKSTVLDCIDITSIKKTFLYVGVRLPFLPTVFPCEGWKESEKSVACMGGTAAAVKFVSLI